LRFQSCRVSKLRVSKPRVSELRVSELRVSEIRVSELQVPQLKGCREKHKQAAMNWQADSQPYRVSELRITSLRVQGLLWSGAIHRRLAAKRQPISHLGLGFRSF
jgi:hypothetical protein